MCWTFFYVAIRPDIEQGQKFDGIIDAKWDQNLLPFVDLLFVFFVAIFIDLWQYCCEVFLVFKMILMRRLKEISCGR